MARLFQNFISGTITNEILSGATSFESTTLSDMVAVASPDTVRVVFDPLGVSGDPEIVTVTAHTAATDTATVTRAQESTSARTHTAGTAWLVASTAEFYTELQAVSDGNLPVGALVPYAGTTSPDTAAWLLCDGSSVSTTTYADLFAVVSYTFGGSGGNFNVPDLRGRVPVGLDNLGGSSANRMTDAAMDSLGGVDGSETHALTSAELAAHTHTGPSHTHTGPSHTHSIDHDHASFNSGVNSVNHTHTATTSSNGSHTHASGAVGGFIVSNTGSGSSTWTTSGGTTFSTFANTASNGAHTHTLTSAINSANHTHSVNVPNHSGTSGAGGTGATGAAGTGATGSTGSGTAHANVQPSMALGYLIKAV